jgi:hypothetical protein
VLTPKERAFVEAYNGPSTGAEAARAAGYSANSYGSLKVTANKLLKRDEIRAAIEERQSAETAVRVAAEPDALASLDGAVLRLLEAYAETLSWRRAAEVAGMTLNEMRSLRRRPEVTLAAEALVQERRVDRVACRIERAELLTEIARGAIDGEAAALDPPTHADRMRAIQLLNAMDAPIAQSTKDAVAAANKRDDRPNAPVIRIVKNARSPA